MITGYVIGDCRELMRELPAESVHCVVTSPPYWQLRDYGTGSAQLGLEKTPEAFIAVMVEVFREVWRVLRPDGTLWLNLGDGYASRGGGVSRRGRGGAFATQGSDRPADNDLARVPIGLKQKDLIGMPWRVALALQADGWWLRSDIIWEKPNPLPESVRDRPGRCHEYMFMLTKAKRYYYDREAVKVPASPNTHARQSVRKPRRIASVNPKAAAVGDPSRAGGAPRPRSNASTAASIGCDIVSHRNLRTVWTIPTQAYRGAHYATFPTRLVEPCILAGTSPTVCGTCGAPWRRLVEVEYVNPGNRTTNGPRSTERRRETAGFLARRERRSTTVGWEPTCKHNDASGRAVVLDPFMGSGTVGEVAQKHGRHWLGFDSDPRCADLIDKRTVQQ